MEKEGSGLYHTVQGSIPAVEKVSRGSLFPAAIEKEVSLMQDDQTQDVTPQDAPVDEKEQEVVVEEEEVAVPVPEEGEKTEKETELDLGDEDWEDEEGWEGDDEWDLEEGEAAEPAEGEGE